MSFQNFTTGSFASVLSEARKYRLSLAVAHHCLSQVNDETAAAVWGNVGSIVAFQVGSDDDDHLARQLSKHPGQIRPQDFTSLPKHTAYARLRIDGMGRGARAIAAAVCNDLLFKPLLDLSYGSKRRRFGRWPPFAA
jgi:hypothetical protein